MTTRHHARNNRRSYTVSRPVHDDDNEWVRCPECGQWARIEYGRIKSHRVYEPRSTRYAYCKGEKA